MGRGFADAYKTGQRPYGQPTGDNYQESSPRPQSVGQNRNVARVDPIYPEKPVPEVSKCLSLTRSGAPCKGRPAAGSDHCNFHKE